VDGSIHDSLNLARSFFEHEQVVVSDECHAGGLIEIRDHRAHVQPGIHQARAVRLSGRCLCPQDEEGAGDPFQTRNTLGI
jgi:hypothetical protein